MIRRVGQIIKLITASSILTIGINWDSLTPRATLLIYRRWAEFSIFHFWEMKSVQKELARPILLQARVCGCELEMGPTVWTPPEESCMRCWHSYLCFLVSREDFFCFFFFLWWVAPVTFCEIQWHHITPLPSHTFVVVLARATMRLPTESGSKSPCRGGKMDDFGHDRHSSQLWMFRQWSDFPFYKKQQTQLSGTVS